MADPVRMCAICRRRYLKKDLARYVADASGALLADESGKAPGRGLYLCRDEKCAAQFALRKPAKKRAPGGRKGKGDLWLKKNSK